MIEWHPVAIRGGLKMETNIIDQVFSCILNRRLSVDASAHAFGGWCKWGKRGLLMLVWLAGWLLTPNLARAQSNLAVIFGTSGTGFGPTYITTNSADVFLATTNARGFIATSTIAGINAFGAGFHFQFAPPAGDSLAVGTYGNTVYAASVGTSQSIMTIFNGEIYVAGESGTFQILEFSTNSSGAVDHLWLTFTNSPGATPMAGQIRFNSQLAPVADFAPVTLHVPHDYATIQEAINAANGAITNTVLVTNGVYYEHLDFQGKFIKLVSVNGPQVTILDGSQTGTVVNFSNDEGPSSVIQGFTIQNGFANIGGGISLNGTSPTIIGNIFLNNTQADGGYGAAIGGTSASPLIAQNLFQNNVADGEEFSGVVTLADPFSGYTTPVIADNVFYLNPACAINTSLWGSTPSVINNTIVSNTVGIHVGLVYRTFTQVYANNLLFGNDVGLMVDSGSPIFATNYPTWENNLVYGSETNYLVIPGQTGENGNISVNPYPFFANPAEGDFHLAAGSPCIDAGMNGAPDLPAVDFDGDPRVLAGVSNGPAIVDIGAFEYNPAAPPNIKLYLVLPTNVVAVAAVGRTSAVVNYSAPTVPPEATLTCIPPAGSIFPAGTNTVYCSVTYGTNSLSGTFSVIVLVPPWVTTPPTFFNVPAGSNAAFAPGVIGTAPVGYQWLFDDVPILNATNLSLVVSNTQVASQGYYQVVLSNALAITTNLAGILQVLPTLPAVVSDPVPVTVSAGNPAAFNASFTGSTPMMVQWYYNGLLLPGANAVPLVISNAQASVAGSYSVTASNSLGTVISLPATLTVLPAKPSFVLQPASAAALAGNSVAFSCQAMGTDDNLHPINYAWFFQNSSINGQTGPQLVLPAIAATNAGAYFVVVSNVYGSATSTVAQLTVYLPPTILAGLSNEVLTVGDHLTLGALVAGTPPLGYNWTLNLPAQDPDLVVILSTNGLPAPPGTLTNTTAFITLTNIQPIQAGYYSVTVTNPFGSASSSGRISVLPQAAQVVAWGDDSGGQTDVPTNLEEVVALAGGDYHSVALRQNGTLLAWGADDAGQTDVPTNALPFVVIAAGAEHNLAIAADGSVVGWGNDDSGQIDIPTGVSSALSVAAGDSHSLALLSSGVVVAWGDDTYDQTNLPGPLVEYFELFLLGGEMLTLFNPDWIPAQAIATGRNHSLALLAGGTVAAWGDNGFGQTSPPANLTNAIAIAAGSLHSVALRSDGTVTAWGDDTFGETNVPPGLTNVVAIAAGDYHTYALRSDGSVVAWGDDMFGQIDLPPSLGSVTAIASGYYHGLAMVPLRLDSQMNARRLVLQWHVPAILQWAPTPAGPYTDVPSPAYIYTNSDWSAPEKYFRLRH